MLTKAFAGHFWPLQVQAGSLEPPRPPPPQKKGQS
jgi:hypothetical protein